MSSSSSSPTSSRSTRASSSKASRSPASETITPTSTISGVSSSASVTSFASASDASGTAVFTNTASVASSSATPVPGNQVQKAPSAVVVVFIILGVLLLGLGGFAITLFLRKRAARQRSAKEPFVENHEPKRQDSYPQPVLPETIPYFPNTAEGNGQSRVYPLGAGARSMSKQKSQSSRASSSIMFSDEDLPMNSRTNFLRPVSLGESTSSLTFRGMQLAQGPQAQAQLPTLDEDQDSPKLPPNLAITTPGRVEMPHDEEMTPVESSHIFTLTHFGTPDPSPLPFARNPSPAPVPFVHRSFDAMVNRNSYASLAPSRSGVSFNERSRPRSMASVYSTRTQNQLELPDTLAPDVLAALSRLKNRISTPWSIASVDTYRTERSTLGRTEEV